MLIELFWVFEINGFLKSKLKATSKRLFAVMTMKITRKCDWTRPSNLFWGACYQFPTKDITSSQLHIEKELSLATTEYNKILISWNMLIFVDCCSKALECDYHFRTNLHKPRSYWNFSVFANLTLVTAVYTPGRTEIAVNMVQPGLVCIQKLSMRRAAHWPVFSGEAERWRISRTMRMTNSTNERHLQLFIYQLSLFNLKK